MGAIKTVVLKGDYGSDTTHERQAMALREGCDVAVEFHFNSASAPSAKGVEVFYKPGDARSRELAAAVCAELARIGLPLRRAPVKPAPERGGYIRHYAMPAVLLEPLFVSNAAQAAWLHDAAHFEALAVAIVGALRGFVKEAGVIGLSPGHAYKTSSPRDPGARCVGGDTERVHTLALVARVEALLAAG